MLPDSRFLDTIVALATPAGRSALAVVRVSGSRAREVLCALTRRLPAALSPRRTRLTTLRDCAGETIDTALVTFFAEPASATGEDLAELSVHGSPAVIERLLRAAVHAGARMARAGEFTERAFRSGKIDLVKAEAVRDLIEARTEGAARVSARRLEGALSGRLERVREELLVASAGLAATIDFAEDVGERVAPAVFERLSAALETLGRLAESYETGRLLSNGCRVAILGPPNAGKSTLFNALLGTARAIVTEIPGTTRDTLEATVDIRGIPVTLVDTAGLRDTQDLVERIGVARARDEMERADAILYVFDAAAGWTGGDEANLARSDGKPRVVVANKADLVSAESRSEGAVPLCGLAPEAGDRLRALLEEKIAAGVSTAETSEVLGSLRQKDLVDRAREAAAATLAALQDGLSPEYAATHCHAALDALADLVGETTSDDVLERLFSTFCIGK